MRNDYKVFQRNNSLEHMRGHMAQRGKRGRENGIHQMLSRHCGLIAGLSVVETEGNTRLFSAPTPSFFRCSILSSRAFLFSDAVAAMVMPKQ